jgi:hypothetical protein
MGSPIGRLLIRQFNLFVNVMIPAGHRLTKPTNEQMAHYQKALDSSARREASAVFRREVTASRAFLADVEVGLPNLAAVPTLIIWATPTSRSGITNCGDGSRPSPTTTPSSSKAQVTSSNPMPPSSSRQRSATGTLPQGRKWSTTHD